MCGRYTLTNPDPAQAPGAVRPRRVGGGRASEPRYNIAPDRSGAGGAPARGRGRASSGRLRWGLVPGRWAEKTLGPAADQRARRDARSASRPSRVVPRAPLPDPRRRLLRVARRRARQDARSGSAAPTASCSRSPGSGPSCRARDGDERPPQLRDRHLRAERADAPDPRPDAGDPRARTREARWLDPDARGGRAARAAGAGARGAARGPRGRRLVNNVREDGPQLIEPREEQPQLF